MIASDEQKFGQRAEITRAFIARHGYDPEHCKQVHRKGQWLIVKLDDDESKQIRRELIERLFYAKGPTRWQRLCLKMARLK